MKISEIKELIGLLEDSAIEEFEMEKSGVRIRLRKSVGRTAATGSPEPSAGQVEANPAETASLPAAVQKEAEGDQDLHLFTAPIVGTFYITPKPDAEPLVQVGTAVQPGKVLCIIEAMKIFNQIESDVEGEIVEILVENGKPVEFGEALFKIRLSS
jgi:oxaloacetate decarboxylase (Na+ extruding) subunit alpha